MTPGPQGDDLGQHLLVDDDAVRRIVAAARLLPGERVLDAGAGTGAITRRLSHAVGAEGTVYAVEKDAALAAALRDAAPENVQVIERDLLTMELPALDAVVANPPFRIAAPLIERCLRAGRARLVLVVPRELADRLAAPPGTERYGRLTVRVAAAAGVEDLGRLPRGAFSPAPAVDCALVRIQPRTDAPPYDPEVLARVVDLAFAAPERKAKKAFSPVATALRTDSAALAAFLASKPWHDTPVRFLSAEAFVEVTRFLAA